MEFLLKLSDALQDLKEQPDPALVGMMASSFLVPQEYRILRQIVCPACGGYDWQTDMSESLVPKAELDWPFTSPGGDRHHCRCKRCNHTMIVTFWFTK